MGGPEIHSFKAGSRSGKLFATTEREKYWFSVGFITTPHGIVGVYRDAGVTVARFVFAGREWVADWSRTFTDARLVTECKRFAASVALPHPEGNPK